MQANEQMEKIKQIIIDLLKVMGFEAEVYTRLEEDRTVFNIKTRDAYLLIGKLGANLESLQYVIKLIFRKLAPEDHFSFAVDIDDYKDKRTLYLKDLARKAAHHVRETQKPVKLEAMPAYERRVVHSYLSLYSDVSSQSVGVEPDRRLVISPKAREKDPDGFNFIENS